MKKTLFTLSFLALAPLSMVASAAEPILDATNPNGEIAVPFTQISLTVAYVFDWEQAVNLLGPDGSSDPDWSPELTISYNGFGWAINPFGAKLYVQDGSVYAGISVPACSVMDTRGGDYTASLELGSETYNRDGNVVLTYAYEFNTKTSTSYFYLYALQCDGSLDAVSATAVDYSGLSYEPTRLTSDSDFFPYDTLTLNMSEGVGTRVLAFDSKLSEAEIAQVAAKLAPVSSGGGVPEPGTTTLSLLALSSLVARRRRAC